MRLQLANECAVKAQAGMVLLLCLLFLTALTLLGLSASADAILQNQLAANLQETERARQSALGALSWAEEWLLSLDQTGLKDAGPDSCITPCRSFALHPKGDFPPQAEFADLSWWMAQGYEAGIDPLTGSRLVVIASGSADPSMWIATLAHEIPASADGSTPAQSWYRVLARGSGHTRSAVVVIESTITKTWWPKESGFTPEAGRVSWRELR